METINLEIDGMGCPACTEKVEMAALQLSGVIDCVVNYDKKHAAVQFNPQTITLERIQQGLGKAGYDATPLLKI